MQITKINNDKQKLITTSLIVSTIFCEKIVPLFLDNKDVIYKSFDSFNITVINWCIDYYKNYSQAPKQHIQDIFNSKKQQLDEEERQLIKQLLKHLSDKYERDINFNEQYVIDQAKLYIREVNLSILNKEIDRLKKEGKIEEAEYLVLTYNKIDKETEKRQSTNLFNDIEKAEEVCSFNLNNNTEDQLFKFPGELGKVLEYIYREDFFTLVGATKKGKSFYLREIALYIAINFGLNVFIFNLEMSHKKYLRNFYQNITGEIKKIEDKEIRLPYFEKQNDKYVITYKTINKKGLTFELLQNKLKKTNMKTKGNIIVESFPSNTLTFQKCVNVLDEYVLKDMVCDVLLIDYLDNMKTHFQGETRHALDDKWVSIRRLAQEKHIAVGTVKHSNISTFKGNVEPGKLSEDNRALHHVTHAIGINQLSHEKRQQYSRLNIFANRDEECYEDQFFLSLECRDIGKVMLDTKNMRDVILTDEE